MAAAARARRKRGADWPRGSGAEAAAPRVCPGGGMDAAEPRLREQVVSDLPSALALLRSLQEQVVAVTAHVRELLQRVRASAFPTEKGLSFLELKAQLLLFYLLDLAQVLLRRSWGRTLVAQPALLRLVEIRTVLEKMRPIEQKLRYQLDKLAKAAVTGAVGDDNPLRFKPAPGNLMSKLSDSGEEEEGDAEGRTVGKTPPAKGGPRKYIPPRLVPVHYDETEAERERKALEQAQKRALSSSVIRELKEQFSDAPEEIREGRYLHPTRQSREEEHRQHYEEAMLVRLNVSRREKAQRRRAAELGAQLHSLTHFGDISALTGVAPAAEGLSPPKKRRKKISAKRGRRKGFRKRR
ncbi:neuroguidin [Carettochelys insculpta]|uniref:neuroguidin n=1 Tax=Carettochelys insculpta TaxID=44489 RepID=UPI003EBCC723